RRQSEPSPAWAADRCRLRDERLGEIKPAGTDLSLNDVGHASGSLRSNPARFGHVHLLIVGTAILDLVVRARAGGAGVTDIRAVRHGHGAGRVQLPAGVVNVIDHEAQMMNARRTSPPPAGSRLCPR